MGYTGSFQEKLLEAPPSLTEPMPDGSKTDPPLAKAISDSGGVYGKKEGEKKSQHMQFQPEREVRIHDRKSSADTKASGKEGGEGAPNVRAKILLQPVVKTMAMQAFPLQPNKVHSEQISTCCLWKTPL